MLDTYSTQWYPQRVEGLTHGQFCDLKSDLKNGLKARRTKKMTPTTTTDKATDKMKVQRTVFDLATFDDVKLIKEVQAPKKPESIQEASEMLGNDTGKLLAVIYDGLMADAREKAYNEISGFCIMEESGEAGVEYSGKFADEEKGKLINSAVLSIAKMQGYNKDLTAEKKRTLKDNAMKFLRDNPAMLQSIQG